MDSIKTFYLEFEAWVRSIRSVQDVIDILESDESVETSLIEVAYALPGGLGSTTFSSSHVDNVNDPSLSWYPGETCDTAWDTARTCSNDGEE